MAREAGCEQLAVELTNLIQTTKIDGRKNNIILFLEMPTKEKKSEAYKTYYAEHKEELLKKQRERRRATTAEERQAEAVAKSERRFRQNVKANRKRLSDLAETATSWKPFIKRLSECVDYATPSEIDFLMALLENGSNPRTPEAQAEARTQEENTITHNDI